VIPEHETVHLGTRGAGVTSAWWPMSDASIRRTPLMDTLSSTIEYWISVSSSTQSTPIALNGPT
jgi:hypothetical protein